MFVQLYEVIWDVTNWPHPGHVWHVFQHCFTKERMCLQNGFLCRHNGGMAWHGLAKWTQGQLYTYMYIWLLKWRWCGNVVMGNWYVVTVAEGHVSWQRLKECMQLPVTHIIIWDVSCLVMASYGVRVGWCWCEPDNAYSPWSRGCSVLLVVTFEIAVIPCLFG